MALWSGLIGRGDSKYVPWSAEFFRTLEKRQAGVAAGRPLPGYEDLESFAVLEKRDRRHHTWLTVRRPKEWLFTLKMARPARGAAPARIAEEVSLLVGLSTSYHLAPFDVLGQDSRGQGTKATYVYCVGDLEERANAGELPAAEIAHYGLQLSAELADIHANGLLHLAIEPANVLIERLPEATFLARWRVMLANFDLRGCRVGESQPPDGLLPDAFCAPELHAGEKPTPKTDLWGLGATLFFLATRQTPVEARAKQGGGGGVPRADAISTKIPSWLAEVIESCLQDDPARRPADPAAVFDALLKRVRIISDAQGAEGASKGSAGPRDGTAVVEIADRFLLASASRLGRVPDGPSVPMKDLGWMTRYKEVKRLFDAGTPSALRRAVAILDRVLGAWDDPQSLLGQFASNPFSPVYDPKEPQDRRIGNEVWGTAGMPLPIGMLWALLDRKCECMILIVEGGGDEKDVEALGDFASRWLETRSCGSPSDKPVGPTAYPSATCLSRIAQGLRFAGEFERAKSAVDVALKETPRDFLALLTAFMVERELENYDGAEAIAEKAAALAVKAKSMEAFAKVHSFAAELALRKGDLATAQDRYKGLRENVPGPEVEALARQVDCRIGKCAASSDVDFAVEVARAAKRLEFWYAAADMACLAKDWKRARELIANARSQPGFGRASHRWYRSEFEKLSEVVERN